MRTFPGGSKPPLFSQAFPAIVAALLPFGLQLVDLSRRAFDEDELEHLHAAWCFAKGLIPYRDFFEHHSPGLIFLLAPFLKVLSPDTAADVVPTLLLARLAFWIGAGGLLAAVAVLGARWRDVRTGCTAAALLAGTLMFLDKAAEVRPDPLATLFWLGALAGLFQGVRAHRPRDFFWGGLCLGAGVMFTQKLLFGALGAAGALGWYVFQGPTGAPPRPARLRAALVFIGAAALPVAAVTACFAAWGALPQLWFDEVWINAHWRAHFSAWIFLRHLLLESPFLVPLALAGIFRAQRGDMVLAMGLGGLLLGLVLIPVPYAQYFLLFLPLLALFGADALLRLPKPWPALLLAALCLNGLWRRQADVQSHDFLRSQLQLIRFVHTTTQPADTVLDGWTGLGVFRPHAFFYFFLHQEIRAILPAADKQRLLQGLQDGTINPALILYDEDLRALMPPPDKTHVPVVFNLIWRRKTPQELALDFPAGKR